MPGNKKAIVRYLAYDKCLSNPYQKYGWEDLLKAANDALIEESLEGISKSQFFEDIKFMEMCTNSTSDLAGSISCCCT